MTAAIRPATSSDFPAIVTIGLSNTAHPLSFAAWRDIKDAYPVFLARYQHLFSLPFYHFLVAVEGEEVVGYVGWKESGEHEEPEFKPEFPEGANVELIVYFLGKSEEYKKGLGIEGLAELEILGVSPKHQRKGIGAALLKAVLEEVDKRGEKMYVKSSKMGKGLYEKLGWKEFAILTLDLSQFGVDQPYTNWDMMREVGGV